MQRPDTRTPSVERLDGEQFLALFKAVKDLRTTNLPIPPQEYPLSRNPEIKPGRIEVWKNYAIKQFEIVAQLEKKFFEIKKEQGISFNAQEVENELLLNVHGAKLTDATCKTLRFIKEEEAREFFKSSENSWLSGLGERPNDYPEALLKHKKRVRGMVAEAGVHKTLKRIYGSVSFNEKEEFDGTPGLMDDVKKGVDFEFNYNGRVGVQVKSHAGDADIIEVSGHSDRGIEGKYVDILHVELTINYKGPSRYINKMTGDPTDEFVEELKRKLTDRYTKE